MRKYERRDDVATNYGQNCTWNHVQTTPIIGYFRFQLSFSVSFLITDILQMLNASSQMKLQWKPRPKASTDAHFQLLSVLTFTFGFNIDIRHLENDKSIIPNKSSVKTASKTKQRCDFQTTFTIKFHFRFHFQKSSSDILCALVSCIVMSNFNVIDQ